MKCKTRIELSVMMFIEFFIWGAWFVTMSTYLNEIKFSGKWIGQSYSTTNWAAIISPFFIGMIADRFFSAEKVLGVMHLLGAAFIYWASTITEPLPFYCVLLGYTLCYMPTVALVNAISFYQMEEPQKQFPSVRVLGTLGWIVANLVVGWMKVEHTSVPMKIAAGASLALGLYSFFLPHTPPKSAGKKIKVADILGLEALKLMKDRSFAIFVLGSLLICIPLAFYYNFTNLFLNEQGVPYAASKMSMGQMSEVVFMLIMPLLFARWGVKWMLISGMLAWAVRYICFAFGDAGSLMFLFYIGILLHGICYDFFFVAGQIYVDKKAPVAIQASAQGFIALVTYGVGLLIGSILSGWVVDLFAITDATGEKVGHAWKQIWLIPAAMAAVVILLFAIIFRESDNTDRKPATAQ